MFSAAIFPGSTLLYYAAENHAAAQPQHAGSSKVYALKALVALICSCLEWKSFGPTLSLH